MKPATTKTAPANTGPGQPNGERATWLAYCRAGFEPDLAAEFAALAGAAPSQIVAVPASGLVRVSFAAREAKRLAPVLVWSGMTFARQCLRSHETPIALPSNDRVTPILASVEGFLATQSVPKIRQIAIEYPDTNEGKTLSKLSQALHARIAGALTEHGTLDPAQGKDLQLHVLLTPERQAFLGVSSAATACPWHNGIARLRMPHDAPSRSTLKLAEAIHVFLGDQDERLMQPEMRAVDLGAAPGGWTWQLMHRGMHVTAVDNGPLKGELVDNALVRHLREDGFRYRPRKAVDWMVCDMVESPIRIAQLVALWMRERLTERSIFNLKLPMKKRYEEVQRCRAVIAAALQADGRPFELKIKQLYHDREEVTGFCRFIPRSERR